jgi:tripartite-type tricarboxylate transporter receptor subunit TctC
VRGLKYDPKKVDNGWGTAMKILRREFLHLAASAAALPVAARIARAETYPVRQVRMIAGFPAGTAGDVVARLIAQSLSERLGQPFVVENQPGAGSNIATEIVAHAAPDGYSLLLVTQTNTANATLYQNLSFNFARDIVPVASIGDIPFVLVANPSIPAKTISEFIAYAKANPGKINMASLGIGTAGHVFGELFKQMAGVDLVHVPYRGNYLPDLLAGQVQVVFSPIQAVMEYIRSGGLYGYAVTTTTRSKLLPDVPAMSEFVPGYDASGWDGIGAPKGTPAEVIEKLNQATNLIITDPAINAHLVDLGVNPLPRSPAEFSKHVTDEIEKWGKVIQTAGIKVN